MKVLKVTIRKVWFNKILSGKKTEEYREIKDYWTTRLKGKNFDAVQFFCGAYCSEKLPNFTRELKEVVKGSGVWEWGALPGVTYYVLRLGKLL